MVNFGRNAFHMKNYHLKFSVWLVKLLMTGLNLNTIGEMEEFLPFQSWNEEDQMIRRSVKSIVCYTYEANIIRGEERERLAWLSAWVARNCSGCTDNGIWISICKSCMIQNYNAQNYSRYNLYNNVISTFARLIDFCVIFLHMPTLPW